MGGASTAPGARWIRSRLWTQPGRGAKIDGVGAMGLKSEFVKKA